MMAFIFETVVPHGQILLVLGLVFGLYMAWSIGANDVANAIGTAVGSGGLTLKCAVILAGIMEFAGAVLLGSHVSDTVRGKMFDASVMEPLPLVIGFMAALLASATWLHIATSRGWPVSTTHTIVGAVVGIGILIGGVKAINWGKIGEIVISWGTSPIAGGIIAFVLFQIIQRSIIDNKHPLRQTYKFIPFIVFVMLFVLALVLVWKGLKNVIGRDLNLGEAMAVAAVIGIAGALLSLVWVKKLRVAHEKERMERGIEVNPEEGKIPFIRKEERGKADPQAELRPALVAGSDLPAKRWEHRREFEFEKVERVFATLLIVSAGFLAFAHGANDTANAIGPLAAIISILQEGVVATKAVGVPMWLLVVGGVGIVVGLATYGYKVIETIGTKITPLTPSRGFAANLGAATTIVIASRMGFPISTTHTLVGAVLGIGLARGLEQLNLRVIRDIVFSWITTVPAGAIFAAIFYYVLRAIFM